MNVKLKQLLEARKKAKGAKFKQTSATKAPGDAFNAPKKGLSGAGPEGAKTPVKPKSTVKESRVPAFGARFNRLFEQTLTEHENMLAEEDGELYAEYDMMSDDDQVDSDLIGAEGEDVTITLDKETAKKLHALLAAVIGGEEDGGEGEEEGGEDYGLGESKDEEEEDDEEVVEEEGHYSMGAANLAAGAKLAQTSTDKVKCKQVARPGKASPTKSYDSSGKLSAVGAAKPQPFQVKSSVAAGKDLF